MAFRAGAVFAFILTILAGGAWAQSVWVQIEAQPTLREAQQRAQAYAAELPDVNGFALASGWYSIALGPYTPETAQNRLSGLLATRQVPRDSYIVDGGAFQRQFWPVGANLLNAQPVAPATGEEQAATAPEPEPLIPAEETPAEARRSERELDREAREAIQVALQWEGHYQGAIDAAFGPGTRNAMAAWQEANNYEPTGVLTTKQRTALVEGYRAVLQALSLRPVTDEKAGITIEMPTGMVAFDRYEPPFAHYTAKDDSGVRVVLISQTGDQATLGGLYSIMQTLEIMPLQGPRELSRESFLLTGANDSIVSHAEARVTNGTVKGWVLIWPAGDEKRRALAVEAMKASFTPLEDAVLPDMLGDGAEQSVDLLSGLQIRRPDAAGTGFFVDEGGRVLTSAGLVEECSRVMLDDVHPAQVAATSGPLALLQPEEPLAPMGVARFEPRIPRLNSEIAVSGFSYGGRLSSPTLTYGTLAELSGLDGSAGVIRLALAAQDGDAGGPVYDSRGAVLGMLLDAGEPGRVLPPDVAMAADMESIISFLSDNGISPAAADAPDELAPQDMIRLASGMTVMVGCYR